MKLGYLLLLLLRLEKLSSSQYLAKNRILYSLVWVEQVHRLLLITTIQRLLQGIQKIYLILRTSIIPLIEMILADWSLGRGATCAMLLSYTQHQLVNLMMIASSMPSLNLLLLLQELV